MSKVVWFDPLLCVGGGVKVRPNPPQKVYVVCLEFDLMECWKEGKELNLSIALSILSKYWDQGILFFHLLF